MSDEQLNQQKAAGDAEGLALVRGKREGGPDTEDTAGQARKYMHDKFGRPPDAEDVEGQGTGLN